MLAFDRDRVRSLASAVTDIERALARWTQSAHGLAEVTGVLAAASRLIERWPTRLAELANCDAMAGDPPDGYRLGDRLGLEAHLLTTSVGWEMVRDGDDTTHTLLRDTQLTALVRRLDDTALRALLAEVIAVRDPTVLAPVIAALPPLTPGGRTESILSSLPPQHVGVVAVHLGTTPELARATLAAIERLEGGLGLLVHGESDPRAVTDLVARAVGDLAPAHAGAIILPYARLVVGGGTYDDDAYQALLGGLVAPFLLQFTSRATDWNLDQADAARLLAEILRDSDAMEELLAARDRWSMPSTDGDIDATIASLDDIAGMLGWFDAIVHDEEIDDGLRERALWEVSWFAIGAGVNLAIRATGITGAVHTVTDRIADEVLARLQRQMELDGTFGAPRTDERIKADADARHDWRRATLAAAAASAAVHVLRAEGRHLPDPPPPPPSPVDGSCSSSDWLDGFDAWADRLDRRSRRLVHHAVRTVLNRYQAAEACFELGRG